LLSTTVDIAAKMKQVGRGKVIMFNGMGTYSLGSNQGYFQSLENAPTHRPVSASDWWREVVFMLDDSTPMTRRDVVLTAANKDGGTHVDANLTPEYERLIDSDDLGSWVLQSGDRIAITNHHYVALRQMAYEVLHSSELVALGFVTGQGA
jgi:hypothetical protein